MFSPKHSGQNAIGTRSTYSHIRAEFAERSPDGRAKRTFPLVLLSLTDWFMDMMVEGLAPWARNERRSFDLIVVGTGPTGLTAALYAGRAGIETLLIDQGKAEGGSGLLQCVDYCSMASHALGSTEPSDQIGGQETRFDLQVLSGKAVTQIGKEAGCSTVSTDRGEEYRARVVLLATGTHFRRGEGSGEEDSTGSGIQFCPSCGGLIGLLNEEQDVVVSEDGDGGQEEPNTDFLRGVIDLDHRGFIKTGENLETSLKGVFAAGSVRVGFSSKEISTEDEGATAALMIWDHLEQTELRKE